MSAALRLLGRAALVVALAATAWFAAHAAARAPARCPDAVPADRLLSAASVPSAP